MHFPMLKTLAATAVWAALLGAAPAAHAADYFLEIDGLDGESSFSATLQQWQWPQAMAGDDFLVWQRGFAGGVKVASGDINGRTAWDELVLSAYHHDEEPSFRYKTKNVLVSSFQPAAGGAAQGGGGWIDVISFDSATMSWRPPAAGGGRGDWIEAQWLSPTGGLVGDPAVLGALDELHARRWADGTLVLTAAVPEPGSWALMLGGVGALAWRLRRRSSAPLRV